MRRLNQYPEGPSIQHLRLLAPKTIQDMDFEASSRCLKYWVLGLSVLASSAGCVARHFEGC